MSDRARKESLERLGQQYEQAKIDGNTDLMKKIRAIMERIKNVSGHKMDNHPPKRKQ
jgi:hypothetical protein